MTATTEKPLTQKLRADGSFLDLRTYEQAGGYQAIRKVLNGGMTDANLRGRSGAGFSTGLKWSFVPLGKDAPNPSYLIVNAEEMEPWHVQRPDADGAGSIPAHRTRESRGCIAGILRGKKFGCFR